jgi:hypothetical protein
MDHANRRESDATADTAHPRPFPRSLPRPTIAPSSAARGRRERRLRGRAARLWRAAATLRQMPASGPIEEQVGANATGQVALSPGVRRALAYIFAADLFPAPPDDGAPFTRSMPQDASAPEPLRRVAEERAPYAADAQPRDPDDCP